MGASVRSSSLSSRSGAPDPRAPVTLEQARAMLERDGLLRREGASLRTTRRWQAAMSRAAFRLLRAESDDGADLRVPITVALLELYGDELTDRELARVVEAILPIEARELHPSASIESPRPP
jgi:hypothetical protein